MSESHSVARVADPHVVETAPRASLSPRLTVALAVAAGATAANVWYNQPMLGAMARDLGLAEQSVAAVPTATQLGFALGILLLVPLGDRIARRTLILWQLAATALALIAGALAPSVGTLVAASALIGAGGSTAQQIVPLAAELAQPSARGRVVGLVMSGLLSGVLLARVVSGAVAEAFGWRAMFVVAAAVSVAMAAALAAYLPRTTPTTRTRYGALLLSLVDLARRHRALRRATLTQACVFATLSAFWSVLALLLQGAPFGLGSTAAGAFGVIGVCGILAASAAGRIVDRRGPRGVISLAIGLVAASFVLFAAWPTLPGLVLGVILVDLGAQAAMVSNQTIIFGLVPEARGRINTIYMTGMFLGGALGSAAAGAAWAMGGGGTAGWRAVCAVCLGLAGLAAVFHTVGRRESD